MKDHKIVSMACPACATSMDGAFNTESERRPIDGDPAICVVCRAINVYAGTPVNSLRPPTEQEFAEFMANEHLQKVVAALGIAHSLHGPMR